MGYRRDMHLHASCNHVSETSAGDRAGAAEPISAAGYAARPVATGGTTPPCLRYREGVAGSAVSTCLWALAFCLSVCAASGRRRGFLERPGFTRRTSRFVTRRDSTFRTASGVRPVRSATCCVVNDAGRVGRTARIRCR